MLTGELPIGRFAPPSKKVQIDVRLDEVVLRALEKEPERRYQQASELKTQVETIVQTEPEKLSKLVTPEMQDWARRFLKRWLTPVRTCNGHRVVNWPAALFSTAAIAGAINSLMLQGIVGMFFAVAVASIAVTFYVRWKLKAPIESLPVIDGPASREGGTGFASVSPPGAGSAAAHPAEAGAIDEARQQVRGPAIGLLVLGILELLTALAISTWVLSRSLAYEDPGAVPATLALAIIVPGLVVAVGSLTIAAALKMKRLAGYGLAIAASILALIVSPSNLIGLAIGIWSLVILSRPAIGKAFEQTARTKSPRPAVTRFQGTIGIAALTLCLASFPAALLGGMVLDIIAVFLFLQLIALILGILGRRHFAGKTVAILSGILLIILGPLLMVGLARRMRLDFGGCPSVVRLQPSIEAANEQVVDIAQHPGGPWVAKLPSGITVEMWGVGENKKEKNRRWWRPDGSLTNDRPYETLGGQVFGENVLPREFAVRLGNLPVEPVGTRWQFEPSGPSAGGDRPQAGPENIRPSR